MDQRVSCLLSFKRSFRPVLSLSLLRTLAVPQVTYTLSAKHCIALASSSFSQLSPLGSPFTSLWRLMQVTSVSPNESLVMKVSPCEWICICFREKRRKGEREWEQMGVCFSISVIISPSLSSCFLNLVQDALKNNKRDRWRGDDNNNTLDTYHR